jgi:ApeA N-terminal domain 1
MAFDELLSFSEAFRRASDLADFLGFILGKAQYFERFELQIDSAESRPILLQVYWSMVPKADFSKVKRTPHPADVLLDAVRRPEEFLTVLRNWFESQADRRDARLRFYSSMRQERSYSIDRLIGCANMFDILPSSVVPKTVELSAQMDAARQHTETVFRDLPDTPERESILIALSKLGVSNLKRKIRYRVQKIIDAGGDRFADLPTVTDQAINCRNYYVHGGKRRLDYDNIHLQAFFVNTLDFVFGVSDLIDCGWDFKNWFASIPLGHPFSEYRREFDSRLKNLRKLLQQKNV